MKIDPQIKRKFLHGAAVEQLRQSLEAENYTIDPMGESGIDLVARRGNEVAAFQVKVLGQADGRPITSAAERAEALGASFRLMVVRPEDEMQADVEGLTEALLQAARRAAPSWPDDNNLNVGWDVSAIGDVAIERVAVHPGYTDVDGTASVVLRMGSEPEQVFHLLRDGTMDRSVLVKFEISLDGQGRLRDGSVVEPLDD